jgi:peptidoglycan/xylan/chitin deacetylase (PgdA/CDA1 family)
VITGCTLFEPKPERTEEPTPVSAVLKPDSPLHPLKHYKMVTVQPGDTLSSLAARHLGDSASAWKIAEINVVEVVKPGDLLIIPLSPLEKGGLSLRGHQTVPILTYHKFSDRVSDAVTVTRKAFEDQMRLLKNRGYQVISLDQFFDFLELRDSIPRKAVVITFDDGWRSTYDIAFPILKKYGYPATLFVYTDFINESGSGMTWAMLKEMMSGGVSIQSHTKSHRYLDRRQGKESFRKYFDAIKEEMEESARIIRRRLNVEVKYLAYPYGDTNHLVAALAERLGYRGALTVEREGNSCSVHRYRVKRSMIYGHFDLEDFEKNLKVFNEQAIK